MPFALRARLHVRVGTLPRGDASPTRSTATSTCSPTTSGTATTRTASATTCGAPARRRRRRTRTTPRSTTSSASRRCSRARSGPRSLLRLGDVLALVGELGPRGGRGRRGAASWPARPATTARRAGPRPRWPRSPASTAATRTRAPTWSAPPRASRPPARTTARGGSCTSRARSPPSAGDFDEAREHYEASLAIRERLGDAAAIGSLYSNLGVVAEYDGDYDAARALQRAGAGACAQSVGDRWGIGVSMTNLGMIATLQERYADADAHFEEAMRLNREVGDAWMVAIGHNNLGNAARGLGDRDRARRTSRPAWRPTETTTTAGRWPSCWRTSAPSRPTPARPTSRSSSPARPTPARGDRRRALAGARGGAGRCGCAPAVARLGAEAAEEARSRGRAP